MKSIARISLLLIMFTAVAASAHYGSAKLRRDGVLNLYPFPRVGRGSNTWQIPIKDFHFDSDHMKKQLYAFPRVGRNSDKPMKIEYLWGRDHGNVKRESENDNGMWFGPRLGRSMLSEEEDVNRFENERGITEQIDNDNNEHLISLLTSALANTH